MPNDFAPETRRAMRRKFAALDQPHDLIKVNVRDNGLVDQTSLPAHKEVIFKQPWEDA